MGQYHYISDNNTNFTIFSGTFVFCSFALESALCGLKRTAVSTLNRSQIIRKGEVIHMSKAVGQFQSSGLQTQNFPAG